MQRLKDLLQHPHLPWFLAALSVILCLRSLWLGWYADDHMHRAMLRRPADFPELARPPWDIFAFIRGDPDANLEFKKRGLLPWWSSPDLRLSFFRPLSSLTHWLDYRLWPESPWLMHAHSLFWLALAVAAIGFLYRRFEPLHTAGLAALLFAVDDAHIMPAMWLANRNAMVSLFFGVVAFIAHDRWRRQGWRAGSILAPVAFLCSLLSAEIGFAVVGYLLAYLLFFERRPWLVRIKSAAPMLLVGAGWWLAYTTMGYGSTGSGLYIDPVEDPSRYLQAVLTRGPALLWGQFGLPSDLFIFLSESWSLVLWVVALGWLLTLALLFARVFRASRTAGFWATGLLLSVLPSCSTFVSDRLLIFAGIAGMGLVAAFLGTAFGDVRTKNSLKKTMIRTTGWILVLIHLILAPLGLLSAATNLAAFRDVFILSTFSFPSDEEVTRQKVLIVTTPTAFVSLFIPVMQILERRPLPAGIVILGSGIHQTSVSRPDIGTLVLRPHGGFFLWPGGPPPSAAHNQAPFDRRYAYPLFDHLFLDEPHTEPGQRFFLDGLTVEVLEITEDGRPLEVAFRFDRDLEDESLRWIRWEEGAYVPFELPRVGESVTLPFIQLAPSP